MNKNLLIALCAGLFWSADAGAAVQFVKPAGKPHKPTASKVISVAASAGQSAEVAGGSAASRSGEVRSMEFGYCSSSFEWADGIGASEAPAKISAAFRIDDADIDRYAGATVKAVYVLSGTSDEEGVNKVATAEVFLREELDGEPFRTAVGSLSAESMVYNEIRLDNPYVIEKGKPFYVGFTVDVDEEGVYPVVSDNNLYSSSKEYMMLGYEEDGETYWENYTAYYGAAYIKILLEGELPHDDVAISGCRVPFYVEPGREFAESPVVEITNIGCNSIDRIVLGLTVGEKVSEIPVNIGGLNFGETAALELTGLKVNDNDNNLKFAVSVTEVNGISDTDMSNNSYSTYIKALEQGYGYQTTMVLEENTSNWNGWAPAGIVNMRFMAQNYPDDFIPVCVHMSIEDDEWCQDPMSAESYAPFFAKYSDVCLLGAVNRIGSTIGASTYQYYEMVEYYNQISCIPAFADIDLEVSYADSDRKALKAVATTRFADATNDPYSIAFVLTENQVGPFVQTNYYSGEYEDMDGWEDMDDEVDWLFDFVARDIFGFNGIDGSLPASLKKDTPYEFATELSLDNLYKKDNFNVIAFVVNNLTGAIENATMVKSDALSGIDGISGEPAGAYATGGDGRIIVTGEYSEVKVYSATGMLISTANGVGSIDVSSGIYIVDIDGRVAKVAVR